MNIYIDHSNFLTKPNKILKNQDYLSNKLKPLNVDANQNESHFFSKENAKINCLKHDFKTPAIVHTHKLPKAFNSNFSNGKLESGKSNEEMKIIDNKSIFHFFFFFSIHTIMLFFLEPIKKPKINLRR